MHQDDGVSFSNIESEKQQLWDAVQLNLAQRVRVPQTDGVIERPDTFYKDVFALPESLLSSVPVCTSISAQLERDIAYQRQWKRPISFPLRFVGGLDISFVKGTNIAVACLVVLEYPSMQKRGTYMHRCEIEEPYIPGYLAFREVRPLLGLFEKVSDELSALECMPQLLLIDGCGVHHPRRCGLASHLGVLLGIPTIGCAKKFMAIDGQTRDTVSALFSEADEHIARPVIGESGALWCYAVRPNKRSRRFLFISPGHCVGYATAVALALSMCLYRVPEPIRAADLSSREYIRQFDVLGKEENNLSFRK